jgi:hypothetical protein
VPVLTYGLGVPANRYESWDEEKLTGGGVKGADTLSRGALNKYAASSIVDELRRIVLGTELPHEGLIEIEPGKWFDPHAAALKATDYETAIDSRRRLNSAISRVKDAKVVFLTLGLIESWFDTVTQLPWNRAPGGMPLMRMADRLEFVSYTYDEIVRDMVEVIRLILDRVNPDMRFIITVSPVPFHATFKEQDILVANSASKSTLRAICDDVFGKFDCVDYFPSYELVTLSPRDKAWESDQLHVRPEMVRHIMTQFYGAYYPDPAA